MRKILAIIATLLCGSVHAQTINNLTAGGAVSASDLFPAYQGANPATGVSAAQIKTFTNTLGSAVSNFGGLQFALAQGGIGNPGGSMTGYVAGDNVTLQCPGVTFATAPVLGVTAASAGAITAATVANPGITSGTITNGSVACTQASTSGAGAGYTVTVTFGVIAAYVSVPALNTGGGVSNGNFFLNYNPNDAMTFTLAGPENTCIGDKACPGLLGTSGFNTAVGHGALTLGGTGAISSANSAYGSDAGRNIQGGASNGWNTMLGYGAGRNIAAGFNTFVGAGAASSNQVNTPGTISGYGNTSLGYNTALALAAGVGNLLLGIKAGSAIVNGNFNIIMGATGAGDNCANGDESNVFAVCPGAGRVLTITGGGTPSTSVASFAGVTKLSAIKTVAGLPTCNGGAEGAWSSVSDATAPTYNAALTGGGAVHVPVYCNGTIWTSH